MRRGGFQICDVAVGVKIGCVLDEAGRIALEDVLIFFIVGLLLSLALQARR